MKNTLFIWKDIAILVADGLTSSLHRHHLIKLTMPLEGKVSVRVANSQSSQEFRSVVVQPDVEHEMCCPSRFITVLLAADFFGCKKHAWKVLEDPSRAVVPLQIPTKYITEIQSLIIENASPEDVLLAGQKIVEFATNKQQIIEKISLDPRIIDILNFIEQHLDQKLSIDDIAEKIHLSPPRTMTLFKRHIGIPVRRYIQWMRIRKAIYLIGMGANFTDVSHQVGFTDLAHFSKSFKSVFGFAPQEVIGKQMDIKVCEALT